MRDKAYGSTGSTEGMGGASGSSKTTGVKQSEVSKDQRQFDKKINQARIEKTSKTTNTSGYSQSNKPTPGSEPTLYKKVKPNKTPNNIPVTPSRVVDYSPFDAKSGTKNKGTRTISTTTPPKGKEYFTGKDIKNIGKSGKGSSIRIGAAKLDEEYGKRLTDDQFESILAGATGVVPPLAFAAEGGVMDLRQGGESTGPGPVLVMTSQQC